MTHAPLPSLTFGAYALTPGPDADAGRAEAEFYTGLGDLPVATIEFPLLGEGAPALDKLRAGVEDALTHLGTGFLAHPANSALRADLSSGAMRPEDYHRHLLRLVSGKR